MLFRSAGGPGSAFKIGIAAHAVLKGLHDGEALAGRDAPLAHGPFGGAAEILDDAARLVLGFGK